MKIGNSTLLVVAGGILIGAANFSAPQQMNGGKDLRSTYTYEKDVAPILKQYCLSCHGSDNMNPSDLYMDDFATLMKGGKHGVPIVPGQPGKSLLYLKLTPDPPFGKQMPRGHKKITPEAVQIIHDWIEQGAKEK